MPIDARRRMHFASTYLRQGDAIALDLGHPSGNSTQSIVVRRLIAKFSQSRIACIDKKLVDWNEG